MANLITPDGPFLVRSWVGENSSEHLFDYSHELQAFTKYIQDIDGRVEEICSGAEYEAHAAKLRAELAKALCGLIGCAWPSDSSHDQNRCPDCGSEILR